MLPKGTNHQRRGEDDSCRSAVGETFALQKVDLIILLLPSQEPRKALLHLDSGHALGYVSSLLLSGPQRLRARSRKCPEQAHVGQRGGVAEWTKATVLKTVVPRKRDRGFESLPLRHRARP